MRIDRLDLIAFGPFTGTTLDLSSGKHGLHVIHGPNEAGKSSALRGVRQLLFGFKHNSTDHFVHPFPDLRIGATLRHEGESIAVIRRKARAGNSLFAPDDASPVDEALLAGRYLGGIGVDSFEGMFTLDHLSLSAGGKATLDAGGVFAQVLFGAGLNLPKLRQYQKSLEKQMEELFKPRGSTQKINQVLKQLEANQMLVQEASIKGADWIEHSKRLDHLKDEKAKVDAEWSQVDRDRKRLERIQKALPDLTRRAWLTGELAILSDVPALPENATGIRRAVEEDLRSAIDARNSAAADLDRITRELAEIPSRSTILAESSLIEDLKTDLGGERKAAKDRVKLDRNRVKALVEAEVYLRELNRDEPVETARVPVASARIKATIRDLAKLGNALQCEVQNEARAIAAAERALENALADLSGLPPSRSDDELRRTLESPTTHAGFEENLDLAGKKIASLHREIKTLVAKLTTLGDNLDALTTLPVPDLDVIESFRTRITALEADRDRKRNEADGVQQELRDLDLANRHPEGDPELLDEDALREARSRRDTGWHLIRQAWRDDLPDPAAIREFVGSDLSDDALGHAFERTVAHADDLADRLRIDAARIAERSSEILRRRKLAAKLAIADSQRIESQDALDVALREWSKLWAPCGIDPQSPVVMGAVAASHAKLVEKLDQRAGLSDQVASWQRRMDDAVVEIHRVLAGLGEVVPPSETLASARGRAQAVMDAIVRETATRATLNATKITSQHAVADATTRLREHEHARTRWGESWGQAMAEIGLDADATETQALAVLDAITNFSEARKLAKQASEELVTISQESERFRDRVASIATRLGVDSAGSDPESILAALSQQLVAALEENTRRIGLETRRAERAQAHQDACVAIAAATQRLAELCRLAGCAEPADLPRIEDAANTRRSHAAELLAVEARLIPSAVGAPLHVFAEEAAAFDPDTLPARLQSLEDAFSQLDQIRQTLSKQIGEEQAALGAMKETALLARAEEATADREHLLSRLEAEVDRYAHLRLSWAVLRDAIEEFRKENQAPVLQRAGSMFADLTLGSFEDLRVDLNDKDQPVLVGIRAGSKRSVSVEGMSVGTVDQLYLALKLALLTHYLETHPALPLIVDDLLIQFDDARAAAALAILAELSRRTQILFFTHHDHLVDLARAHLEPDLLFVHNLGRPLAS